MGWALAFQAEGAHQHQPYRSNVGAACGEHPGYFIAAFQTATAGGLSQVAEASRQLASPELRE